MIQNATVSTRMQEALDDERRQAADDRQKLLAQITGLVNAQADTQEARLTERITQMQKGVADSSTSLEGAVSQYGQGMQSWDDKENELLEEVKKSRDELKTKLKDDWNVANELSTSIQATAKSVHAETVRVVDVQVEDLNVQMEALDDFVTRARTENANHHETHGQSVQTLTNTVERSFGNISAHFKTTFERVKNLGDEMDIDTNDLHDGLEPLDTQLCQPLANLREGVAGTTLQEYQPTGDTPQRVQYHYPTHLPRTEAHDLLTSKIDEEPGTPRSPSHHDGAERDDTIVFADLGSRRAPLHSSPRSVLSLREVNPNVTTNLTTGAISFDGLAPSALSLPAEHTMPLFKRSTRGGAARGLKKQHGPQHVVVEGRENVPPSAFAQSLSRRKSPRLH